MSLLTHRRRGHSLGIKGCVYPWMPHAEWPREAGRGGSWQAYVKRPPICAAGTAGPSCGKHREVSACAPEGLRTCAPICAVGQGSQGVSQSPLAVRFCRGKSPEGSAPPGRRAVPMSDELHVGAVISASCGPGAEEGKERRWTLKAHGPCLTEGHLACCS